MPSMKIRPGYTRPEDLDRIDDRRHDTIDKAGMKMLTNNDLITVPQTVALMITTILEIGLLSLPGKWAYANSDGWIIVIIGGILAFVGSLILSALIKLFPNDTFIEYSQRVMGKGPGFILGIVVIIYFTLATAI